MASRTLPLCLGLVLAACGAQPQSVAAANEAVDVPVAAPSLPPAATPSPAAVASAPADAQDHTIDESGKDSIRLLRAILVSAGTMDGKRITDFQLHGRCETVITTASGATTLNWAKVGDWAARYEGDQRIIPIDDGNGAHAIGVPAKPQPEPVGDAGARVEGGFGMLADSCQA